jgi:hypothetical protein
MMEHDERQRRAATMTDAEKAEDLLAACVFGFLDGGMEVRGVDPRDGSIHDLREISDEELIFMIREGLQQREAAIRAASNDELLAMVRRWRVDPQTVAEFGPQVRNP